METGSLFSEILYLLPLLLPPHLESDPDCWGTLTPTASMVGSIRNTFFFFNSKLGQDLQQNKTHFQRAEILCLHKYH